MEITDPRIALSAILRPVTGHIIRRVVDEAARSSGAAPEEIRAYEALMIELAPPVLDAIASTDERRAQTFALLATHDVAGIRPVPPVARVGLLEIGIRLAHDEVANALRGRPDSARITREFDVLAEQMRAALVALGRSGPHGEQR